MQYDVIRHAASNKKLVRFSDASYVPSHDYSSGVTNPFYEGYDWYQLANMGRFHARFLYPDKGYYVATVEFSVIDNKIYDHDNGVNKALTIQNLKLMIKHAVTVKLTGTEYAIDDATAAKAAAQAWASRTDAIAKISRRKKDEKPTSGKHEKTESGKKQGGWVRKQFFMKHSYDTVRTEEYLEHKRSGDLRPNDLPKFTGKCRYFSTNDGLDRIAAEFTYTIDGKRAISDLIIDVNSSDTVNDLNLKFQRAANERDLDFPGGYLDISTKALRILKANSQHSGYYSPNLTNDNKKYPRSRQANVTGNGHGITRRPISR